MANAKIKTVETSASVNAFINAVPDKTKQSDSFKIIEIIKQQTGFEPKMWGPAIIGFGNVHLKYESGRELDWFKMGFSPRKQNLTLYGVNPNQSIMISEAGVKIFLTIKLKWTNKTNQKILN